MISREQTVVAYPTAHASINVDKRTVMIVDDEPSIAQVLSDITESCGGETWICDSAGALFHTLELADPALILLDLKLEDADGVRVIQKLAAMNVTAPIVLISGFDDRVLASARRIAEEHGLVVAGVIAKPFQVDEVEAIVRSALDDDVRPNEAALSRALADGAFEIWVQPKVCLVNDGGFEIAGLEALARWRHPERGLLCAASFIGQVERSECLHAFTTCILGQAANLAAILQDEGIPVAVNLTPDILKECDAVAMISEAAHKYDAPSSSLIVEITENAVLTSNSQVLDALTQLRLLGFGVSMDDFGAGDTSTHELHILPFSEIKVDRSLISRLTTERDAIHDFRSLLYDACKLNLDVCAEGVETRDQAELVWSMGCTFVQGHYYGEPMSVSNFLETRSAYR